MDSGDHNCTVEATRRCILAVEGSTTFTSNHSPTKIPSLTPISQTQRTRATSGGGTGTGLSGFGNARELKQELAFLVLTAM